MALGKLPTPPPSVDASTRGWMRAVQKQLEALTETAQTPGPVTNLTATALPLAVHINFTRSDADRFILYWSATPDFGSAVPLDLGQSAEHTNYIGANNVTRYYWVKARNQGVGEAQDSILAGPVSATSAANNAAVTPPVPPPPSVVVSTDTATGHAVYGSRKGNLL